MCLLCTSVCVSRISIVDAICNVRWIRLGCNFCFLHSNIFYSFLFFVAFYFPFLHLIIVFLVFLFVYEIKVNPPKRLNWSTFSFCQTRQLKTTKNRCKREIICCCATELRQWCNLNIISVYTISFSGGGWYFDYIEKLLQLELELCCIVVVAVFDLVLFIFHVWVDRVLSKYGFNI